MDWGETGFVVRAFDEVRSTATVRATPTPAHISAVASVVGKLSAFRVGTVWSTATTRKLTTCRKDGAVLPEEAI